MGGLENSIRIERAKKRITQQQLADSTGVSRQTIHSVENKKYIPSTELALKLARYFGVSTDVLFRLDED